MTDESSEDDVEKAVDVPPAAAQAEARDARGTDSPVLAEEPLALVAAAEQASPSRTASISALNFELDGGLGRTIRELDTVSRMARESGLASSRLSEFLMGRQDLSATGRSLAQLQQRIDFAGGNGSLADRALRADAVLSAAGGIEAIMRQQREMERNIVALGGVDRIVQRHLVMEKAFVALGGLDAIMKRHDEVYSRLAVNDAFERAMSDIARVTSFTGLLGRSGFDRESLDGLVAGARAWRETHGALPLSAMLRAQRPDLIPEYRRATAADFASIQLSSVGERFARDAARLGRLQDEMLGLRRPWIDVDDPGRSVAGYVEARALATVVEARPAESRAVVEAVRAELGDYRETEPVPEIVIAEPMLRSAFRLEVGFNPDLSSLPPAVVAAVFEPFGGRVLRRIEADPDALEAVVHQRARRLELKLRRFIERRMMAAYGRHWSKRHVHGDVVRRWRERRQLDTDNGRTPSRLFDYAGFEDYRAIVEQADNWRDVFASVFKVKTSILESLRRLSLIRNPDAHYRVVTMEDFLDLTVEGRRIDKWIDGAPPV